MVTKETVKEIIQEAHYNTGHGGVKKTYMKISELYGNIQRSVVSQYILARNQIEFIQYKGLVAESIPPEELSICELVRAGSVCGGQGYQRCHCRSNCLTKRCSCLKAGLRCNSACHSHKSCDNVDK